MVRVFAQIIASLAVAAVSAQAADPLLLPLHGHGSLAIAVPEGWRWEIQQPPGRLPATLVFAPAQGAEAGQVLLTALWSPDGSDISSKETLAAAIGGIVSRLPPDPPPKPLPLEGAPGYWCTTRDPAAPREPGDYPYMTSVVAGVGTLQVACTVLANAEDSALRSEAFAMLASLRAVKEEAKTMPVALTLPGGGSTLRLEVPASFAIAPPKPSEDGRSAKIQAGDGDQWQLTVFFEPLPAGRTSVSLRDEAVAAARTSTASLGTRIKRLETWEEGDRAFLEQVIAAGGATFMRSWNLVTVHGGGWIDVHLSSSPGSPGDRAVFDAMARSVRFEP